MLVAARKSSRRPAPSRPVERPTSIVRTTQPDIFTHDSIRKPRVTLPAIDPKRMHKRRRGVSVRFLADIEIPLVDAAYLQKSFGHSTVGLECFVSLAVQNGATGQQCEWPLPEQQLWVVVALQVSLPMEAVRQLNALTTDPELLAATLSLFIRREIEARKAGTGNWSRQMVRGGDQAAFDLFREG